MPDTDFDFPTPENPRGLCPRCNLHSAFLVQNSTPLMRLPMGTTQPYRERWKEVATHLVCGGCGNGMFVFSINEFGADGEVYSHPISSYPLPGSQEFDLTVSPDVASCYLEGVLALAAGCYRASVVMFRGAIAEFVRDRGSENAKGQRDLFNRLKVMADEGELHPKLVDLTSLIREVGNAGAHSEQYQDVTNAQARSVEKFTRMLIKLEYEIPAEIARFQGPTRIDRRESD